MVYTCLYYILIIPPIYDKSGDGTPSLITMEQRRWEARASTANKARVIAQLVTEVSEKTSKWPQFQVAQGFMLFLLLWFFPVLSLQKRRAETTRQIAVITPHGCFRGTLSALRAVRAIIAQHAGAFPAVLQANTCHDWLLTRSTASFTKQRREQRVVLQTYRKGISTAKLGTSWTVKFKPTGWLVCLKVGYSYFFNGWSSSSPPWIEDTPPFLDPDAWFLCLDCCRHLAVRTKQFRKTCAAMTAQPRSFFVELAGDHKFLVSAFK